MIEHDRLSCDFCGQCMGQLLGGEPVRPGALPDHRTAPNFLVCPDCYDESELVQDAA